VAYTPPWVLVSSAFGAGGFEVGVAAGVAEVEAGVQGGVGGEGPCAVGADVEAVELLGEGAAGDFGVEVEALGVGARPEGGGVVGLIRPIWLIWLIGHIRQIGLSCLGCLISLGCLMAWRWRR
jgi:hypothetical protein